MKGKIKMNKRYLITGVSGVDPYTNIYLVPQIITEKIIDDGSKIEIKYKNNKDTKIPQEVKLDEIFIDGSMLNILRKYIKNGNPITDIYIYLTQGAIIKTLVTYDLMFDNVVLGNILLFIIVVVLTFVFGKIINYLKDNIKERLEIQYG